MPTALADVLAERGITIPTPIQAATLADAVAGRDVLGRGRTGSGKTYAFLLPVVTRLASSPQRPQPTRPRAVVLAPTRELAVQIDTALQPLAAAAGLTSKTVFGGVGQQPQVAALRRGVDVLVACPGRLEDLVGQGHCRLDAVQITVLDEADHMADLGFLPGVTRLLGQTPSQGQRLFFSATLDSGVDGLVKRFLRRPAVHQADSATAPVDAMDHHVLHVSTATRTDVVADLAAAPGRTVVFTRTKSRARTLTRQLNARGVAATELHGNLSQNARTRSLEAFHSGQVRTLVATDIAARGIHVDDVELVVHADPPAEHKAYVHRSGRTARAGKAGTVVTLMTDDQVRDVRALTRAAGIKPVTTVVPDVPHPVLTRLAPGERVFEAAATPPAAAAPARSSRTRSGGPGSGGRSRSGRSRSGGGRGGHPPRGSGSPQPSAATTSTPRTASRQNASRGVTAGSGATHSASSFSRRVRAR